MPKSSTVRGITFLAEAKRPVRVDVVENSAGNAGEIPAADEDSHFRSNPPIISDVVTQSTSGAELKIRLAAIHKRHTCWAEQRRLVDVIEKAYTKNAVRGPSSSQGNADVRTQIEIIEA
jgi:hypothetical protein